MPRYLIPIGGNEKKSADSEIFRNMVQLAGGAKARIVVVPTASEEPKARARDYQELFARFNPAAIDIVHIGERSDADSGELSKVIGDASLFMFGGGDQLRLSSLIGGTRLHETLVDRYQSDNCVIAGTSAGAAAIPELMIFQNNRFRMFRKGGIEMTKGLGMIRNIIFDTHFVERSRIPRLVQAVSTNPALLGIGIGENTGLVIENECTAAVTGTGTVIVVDGSAIEINHVGYVKNGEPYALTNVIYSILTQGVVYDLKSRKIVDPGPFAPPLSIVPTATGTSIKLSAS